MTTRRLSPPGGGEFIERVIKQDRRSRRTDSRLDRRDPSLLGNLAQFGAGTDGTNWYLPISFSGGELTTGESPRISLPGAWTVTRITSAVLDASTSGDIEMDLLKNGSTVMHSFALAEFTAYDDETGLTETYADTDRLSVAITSAGTGATELGLVLVMEPGA